MFQGRSGIWSGGDERGGPWASVKDDIMAPDNKCVNGMLLASNKVGCRAFDGDFEGVPGPDGECDHLSDRLGPGVLLAADVIHWLSGTCIHESLPQTQRTQRQLVRLSMPSDAPWFDGYTPSPFGIMPTGQTLSRRPYMSTRMTT